MSASGLRTARKIVPFVCWGALLIGWCVVVAPGLWTYLLGTPTTAQVKSCTVSVSKTGTETTTCHGSWTVDGERHSGVVDGAGTQDEGKRLDVRVNGDRAATTDTPARSAKLTGFGVVLGIVATGVCWLTLTARMKQAAGR